MSRYVLTITTLQDLGNFTVSMCHIECTYVCFRGCTLQYNIRIVVSLAVENTMLKSNCISLKIV